MQSKPCAFYIDDSDDSDDDSDDEHDGDDALVDDSDSGERSGI